MAQTISNIPGRVDFILKQGSTFSFRLEYCLADEVTPLPVTGQTITLKVRKTRKSNDTLIEVVGVVGTNIGVDDHTVEFVLSPVQTAALPCGCWIHDIDRDAAGEILPALQGSFEVRVDV